jgi:hypothetical protein
MFKPFCLILVISATLTPADTRPASQPSDNDWLAEKKAERRYELAKHFYRVNKNNLVEPAPDDVIMFYIGAYKNCADEYISINTRLRDGSWPRNDRSEGRRRCRELLQILTPGGGLPARTNYPRLEWEVGSVGMLRPTIEVAQIVDKTSFHGLVGTSSDRRIFKGFDVSGHAEGSKFSFDDPVKITGTETYTTVLGATATCFVIEPLDIDAYEKGISEEAYRHAPKDLAYRLEEMLADLKKYALRGKR